MGKTLIKHMFCGLLAAGATFACHHAPEPGSGENPVIIEVGSSRVRLDAYQLYLECNYPEIIGHLDDEMHSFVFDKFRRDLFIAEISQTLVRVTDEQVEDFIRKNEALIRAREATVSFHTLPERTQQLWRKEIRRRLAIQQFLKREILDNTPITNEAIAHYYRDNETTFKQETRYRLRIVQTGSQEQADSFYKALRKSKEPFLEVAKNYATNEGYLLALPMLLEELPEPFRNEVRKLKPGRYSKVIPINYGELDNFYVIHLDSIIEADTVSFEAADGYIREKLEKQHFDQLLLEKIQQFEHRVPVVVYPESLPFKLIDPLPTKEV